MFTTFALLESFPITVRGTSVHWREAAESLLDHCTRPSPEGRTINKGWARTPAGHPHSREVRLREPRGWP